MEDTYMTNLSFKERLQLPRYDDPSAVRPGVITVDREKCSGCSFCINVCPAKALLLENKKAVMLIKKNECVFCGDCASICPEKAITLKTPYEYTSYYKTINRGTPAFPRLFER